MDKGYELTIIEEIETPLSASIQPNLCLFPTTVAVVVITAIFLIGLLYFIECTKYQKRYQVLMTAQNKAETKKCWNLTHLKERIREEEAQVVETYDEEAFHL